MRKPLRPCRAPGCGVLTSEGYCPAHKLEPRPSSDRSAPKPWHRLYKRPEWPRLRAQQLTAEPWCRECAAVGLRVPATEVDHIQPHRGDLRLFLDPGNLQSLCHSCHSRKTMQENPEIFGGNRRRSG